MPDKVRIDKWLWSVRIFKTRTVATDACKNRRVTIGKQIAKPSSMVQRGDHVFVHKEGFKLEFKVIDLIQKRVSAPLAQACYENLTPPEEMSKFDDWYVGKSGREFREKGAGRPTKKERRELDEFKEDRFNLE
ncbi:MAG: RNA-binding S4 domain-containing protein [Saprospiraceae bacterium]|nr:RNA-binding S4 domain-containing protein [Saprospiraceae bacterium]